jgi:hypothetical protein
MPSIRVPHVALGDRGDRSVAPVRYDIAPEHGLDVPPATGPGLEALVDVLGDHGAHTVALGLSFGLAFGLPLGGRRVDPLLDQLQGAARRVTRLDQRHDRMLTEREPLLLAVDPIPEREALDALFADSERQARDTPGAVGQVDPPAGDRLHLVD